MKHSLRLFNSLGGKKQKFHPRDQKVRMYVCGITPYDVTHLGHAFTYTVFDVLARYLRHLGHEVTYVQNLTDIDEDILRKAKELKKDWKAVVQENTKKFLEDMRWLGNMQPNVYARATDHIPDMIFIIQKLLKKNVAYEKNKSVYFSVAKDKEYGKLSGYSKKVMLKIANARGNDPKDPNKQDPLDFVLWRKKKKGEPSWRSPWGQGRPGWHIECSAMAMKYLGETFDIQGGGGDLIFPHHESSIAQSETATKKPFARFWLYVAMVRYKGEKMSKSLGNLVLIQDLKKHHSPNGVRICLLSRRHGSSWEFVDNMGKDAMRMNELFQKAWRTESQGKRSLSFAQNRRSFYQAMNDDLNTPKALRALKDLSQKVVRHAEKKDITKAKAFLVTALHVLGLAIES